MFTSIGGDGSDSVVGGKTGTGVHFCDVAGVEGGRISRPGCPGRWNRRVIEP